MILYELSYVFTVVGLTAIIPLIIGLLVRRPIPIWLCALVSLIPLVIHIILPALYRPLQDVEYSSGILSVLVTFFLLLCLSWRKKNIK